MRQWNIPSLYIKALLVVFLPGIVYLFYPFIDGAMEVGCGCFYGIGIFLFLTWGFGILIPPTLLLILLGIAVIKKLPIKYKGLNVLMVFVYLLLFQVSYPLTSSSTDMRIKGLLFGGQARMALAGGPEKVQRDALAWIDEASHSIPPRSEWPQSIQALGVSTVEIHEGIRSVEMYIPLPGPYASVFGYVIREPGTMFPPVPRVSKTWEIADGVYFVMLP